MVSDNYQLIRSIKLTRTLSKVTYLSFLNIKNYFLEKPYLRIRFFTLTFKQSYFDSIE